MSFHTLYLHDFRLTPDERCARARQLRTELESKLDVWRRRVMEVQEESIRRAEEKARKAVDCRRARVASENRDRC